MKTYLRKSDVKFILVAFILWRATLFIFLFLSIKYVVLQGKYVGGGLENYLSNPLLWAWGNFDGEHYLLIAQEGYSYPHHFFFPVLPIITRFISNLFGGARFTTHISGVIFSNLAFLIALFGFYKLLLLDYSRKFTKRTVVILLLFPTSYYFASFYSEPLFFAFVVWAFYLVRKKIWIWAAILGAFASGTRSMGAILLPLFSVEVLIQREKKLEKFLILGIIPAGLLLYMYYLRVTTGDPFAYNSYGPEVIGEYRSTTPILLPRVYYRYFFKILPNINWRYFPVVFSTIYELSIAILLTGLSIFGITKLRFSYWLYLVLGFIIPTLFLNFVGLPRYGIILFPAYILLNILISKLPPYVQTATYALMFITLMVASTMFFRGYWVA